MSTTTMIPCPGEITKLLVDWKAGDPNAANHLMPLVVGELREIAARGLAKQNRCLTYQATEMVSAIYLRLTGQQRVKWKSREQFFYVCAVFVKRMLLERARRNRASIHGGDATIVPLDESFAEPLGDSIFIGDGGCVDVIDLNDALDRLREFDERAAEIVYYRFFAGFTIKETAGIMGISSMTVDRDWQIAKRWLFRELTSNSKKVPALH